MSKELPKAYEPQLYEDDIYRRWTESGLFNPNVCVAKGVTKKDAQPFSIVLPPPNVTGTLHMGHAVMLAIEDTMVRYHRMKGDQTLWVPGTDHAAIATQSKVEKIIFEQEGKNRHDLGREKFLDRVHQFAQESHDTIVNQAKKMGASLDWSREAFTLDEVRNRAVRLVFKQMYDDGIIYRGSRMINWSVGAQSVLADDELEWEDRQEPFYFIRVGEFIIGTVRPETKCADSPVVVHPTGVYVRLRFTNAQGVEDVITISKYLYENIEQRSKVLNELHAQDEFEVIQELPGKELEGQEFAYPTYAGERKFFVLADEVIDIEKGTGAMTISASHSADDYDLANRRNLQKYFIEKIKLDGTMTDVAGTLAGSTILEARKKSVSLMKEQGLIAGEDTGYVHRVPLCYRTKTVVEPMISKQWFVSVTKTFPIRESHITGVESGAEVTLKQLMQTVVRSGQVTIIPDRFQKTYFQWIDNLRDWCISRQVWYGHRIPVWYCKNATCGGLVVSAEDARVCSACGGDVEQDSDTLDTWFSSGLWTFSTLLNKDIHPGESLEEWLARSEDYKNYHPTSVLETGYDILFFWVARMILMTTYTIGQIPFETVYLHGLVRDEQGRKMSKSLGNIIDPLDMIQKYGTDATRLSLMIGGTPGNDMKLSEEKVAGFRNFANKLWNISRFILLNVTEPQKSLARPTPKTSIDEWILWKLNVVIVATNKGLGEHRFSEVGESLRDFTWGDLADWYLEMAKVEGNKSEILNFILNTLLKLWHPFMPFVTEAIWTEVYGEEAMLIAESFPHAETVDATPEINFVDATFRELVTGLRSLRAEYAIAPTQSLFISLTADATSGARLQDYTNILQALARVEILEATDSRFQKKGVIQLLTGSIMACVDLSELIDMEKEKIRLKKELDQLQKYTTSLEKKLSNDSFVNNAPADVVSQEREKLRQAQRRQEAVAKQYTSLE